MEIELSRSLGAESNGRSERRRRARHYEREAVIARLGPHEMAIPSEGHAGDDRLDGPPGIDVEVVGSHRRDAFVGLDDVPAQEPGDERIRGVVPEIGRRRDLREATVLQHRDPIRERERFVVIVGDEDGRQPQTANQSAHLVDEVVATSPVEGSERFIQHEESGFGGESAREGHALLLATGEFLNPPMLEPGETDARERGAGAFVDFVARSTLHAQAEGDVGEHVAVGEERVVLEHQSEPTAMGRSVGEIVVIPRNCAFAAIEAGDCPQQSGLARPRRSQNDDHLAVVHVEVDSVEHDRAAETSTQRTRAQH